MDKRKLVTILMTALMLSACEKETWGCLEDQPVLFEYRNINFAWGYQEQGWLIDAEGIVRTYHLPEDFRLPDSTGFISRQDLDHNLSLTASIIHTVDKADLVYYSSLIPGASEGEIGKSRHIAVDAGASVLACYFYNEEADAYKYIFLAQSGDFEQFNLSSEAGILVNWLIDFEVFWLSDRLGRSG